MTTLPDANTPVMMAIPRTTNSKGTHYLLSHCFPLHTLKGIAKVPTVDLLRLNRLLETKTAF